MSKIFEALQRKQGDLSELILPSLVDEPAAPANPVQPGSIPAAEAPAAAAPAAAPPKAARRRPPRAPRQAKTTAPAESAAVNPEAPAAPAPAAPLSEEERALLAALIAPAPDAVEPPSLVHEPTALAPQPAGPAPEAPPPVAEPVSAPRTVRVRLLSTAPLLPFDESSRHAAEQYRIVRTRLMQHPRQPRLIVISSSGPGDGKSVTAVNLAGAIALKSEAKVLLVDGDFRRSTLHAHLGLPKSPGLAEVLEGKISLAQALIHIEQVPNLYFLPVGEANVNPSELLDSPRWVSLCGEFRSLFKYAIFDSPPIGAVADYDLIQAACDGVIVVVRPDHTDRTHCMEVLQAVPKEKLIGVVLNCVKEWFLRRSYRYDSGYYYSPTPAKGQG